MRGSEGSKWRASPGSARGEVVLQRESGVSQDGRGLACGRNGWAVSEVAICDLKRSRFHPTPETPYLDFEITVSDLKSA